MSKKNKELFKGIKLNWWQAGFFKTAAISFGIILGVYFTDVLSQYLSFFWVLFVLPSVYILYLWSKQ